MPLEVHRLDCEQAFADGCRRACEQGDGDACRTAQFAVWKTRRPENGTSDA